MFNFLKKFRLVIALVLIIGTSFILGISFGRNHPSVIASETRQSSLNIINNNTASSTEIIDMAPFWKVWNLLSEKYVATHKNSTTTSDQDRIWGAIQGLTNSLGDPYTVFMPPEDSKEFKTDISGNFEGIGMEIGIKDGVLSVVSPLKGSPAEKVGLKTGDKIIMINGESALDLAVDQAVKLIRGPKDTVVKISVLRASSTKPIDFSIIRSVINVPTVETEIKGDVFILRLYNFYAESNLQFNNGLKEFIRSKKHKLIIDLRGNPGGYLDSAVNMASWFLPLGKVIVREDFGSGGSQPENVYRSKGYDVFNENLQMVILVDEGSASASEILAGALQENGKAKLVGTKTFGKGSVQELLPITKDTSLKITVAKWLTPSGKSISENGLTPDYEVKITEADIKADRDPQLDKAMEVLDAQK
jgi:carboxyl-terminal processing protease